MDKNYTLVFDDVMVKQLKKAANNQHIKEILTKMLDKLEFSGPDAGELLDPRLSICEIKKKHPPIRLYFKHILPTNEIYVFEFEIKNSIEKQKATIIKIKQKASELKP